VQTNPNTYLSIVPFLQLESWSVQALLESKFSYNNKYPLVRIGEFLSKSRRIAIVHDNIEYKRVTVRIKNGGVILRDIEKGINIGTKNQYLTTSGQFIISRIDARNGAFGIIPNSLDGAIVTNDFPLFDINKEIINPEFLVLITTAKEFIKFAQSSSSGTTNRQRMDIDTFLNQKIPLPRLEEQDRIANAYKSRANEAMDLEQEGIKIEREIDGYFNEQLGIDSPMKEKSSRAIKLINFTNIYRWDIPFLKNEEVQYTTKYELHRFSDLITSFNVNNGKSIRIDSSKFPDRDFIYIGMEHITRLTGQLKEIVNVKGKDIKSQTLLVPKSFIIYGKLRPAAATFKALSSIQNPKGIIEDIYEKFNDADFDNFELLFDAILGLQTAFRTPPPAPTAVPAVTAVT
jgi:type I restriction enzyme S subunit